MTEIEDFYRFHYAPGLDRLLETIWYSTYGWPHVLQDPPLLDFVAQCAEQWKARTDDAASAQSLQSLEARLVWQLADMPRAGSYANQASGSTTDQVAIAVLPRIETVESLLTGQPLPQFKLPPPPMAEHQNNHTKYIEHNFWHHLGRFASVRDDTANSNSLREINDCFGVLRGILSMMENRDVLYSLAIARHFGSRMADFHPSRPMAMQTNDANDEVNKLEIARQFVESEDQRGTTQVIQRICGMAMRSWILQKQ